MRILAWVLAVLCAASCPMQVSAMVVLVLVLVVLDLEVLVLAHVPVLASQCY